MRLLILALTFATVATATSPATASATEDKNLEVRLIPGYFGYSSYSGLIVGHDFAVDLRLSDHWQWEFGTHLGLSTKGRSYLGVFTGPRYNFSEDFSRSWNVFAGVVYGDNLDCCTNDRNEKKIRPIVEVAKRFKINDSWTYAPSLSFSADSERARIEIRPATFTYSF